MITQNELKERFDCTESGIFTYKLDVSQRVKKGAIAGRVNARGYCQIKIKGKHYYTHRLVWLYFNGHMPSKDIDHIDGNKTNNALTNLREATVSQNLCNIGILPSNKTGVKGLTYHNVASIGAPYYTARIQCLDTSYSKTISVSGGRTDEDIIEELTKWLEQTRSKLHKDFCNHG